MSAGKKYNLAAWKVARKKQLTKEPLCRICKSGNKLKSANVVDHIIPHCGNDVLFWDVNNYQSLCKSCHNQKTYFETNKTKYLPRYLTPKSKDITIIFGPPASGKTTYAKKQGCKIIDLDEIKKTVSNQDPYSMNEKYLSTCFAIRNKMISESTGKIIILGLLAETNVRIKWMKQLKAKLFMMATPKHECIRRVHLDKKRIDKRFQIALINRYFKIYRPIPEEKYINENTF